MCTGSFECDYISTSALVPTLVKDGHVTQGLRLRQVPDPDFSAALIVVFGYRSGK
jgi:hypothetical protein